MRQIACFWNLIHVNSIIIFLIFLFFTLLFFKKLYNYYFLVLFLLNLLTFIFFIKCYFNLNCVLYFYSYNYFFSYISLSLFLISILIGYLCLLLCDVKIFLKNKFLQQNILFIIIVFYFFICENNIYLIFLYYELLLIPSYFLIYYLSPNRRYFIIALYFLLWTQIGSFLVLLVTVYLLLINNASNVFDVILFSDFENCALYFLLYIGFGIKVPIWPFYYWLTKTHVEAPTFFSIYLSGFLVKTALIGFYKFTLLFAIFKLNFVCWSISIFSIIDSSIKLWTQIDLKKSIAYCTVQEMNLMYLLLLINNSKIIIIVIIFSITHSILAALFFYLIDIIYRIYFTRSVYNLTGLLYLTPTLGWFIFFSNIMYAGLPFSLKFYVELSVYKILLDVNIVNLILILFIVNVIGVISLAKLWFNTIFSSPKKKNFNVIDLTLKDSYILFFLNWSLFYFNYLILFF